MYKVGDMVKIVSKRNGYMSQFGNMDRYLSTIMTIDEVDDGLFKMVEDKGKWCWHVDNIERLAKTEDLNSEYITKSVMQKIVESHAKNDVKADKYTVDVELKSGVINRYEINEPAKNIIYSTFLSSEDEFIIISLEDDQVVYIRADFINVIEVYKIQHSEEV